MYSSSWRWTVGCSKHVQHTIITLEHWCNKCAFCRFLLHMYITMDGSKNVKFPTTSLHFKSHKHKSIVCRWNPSRIWLGIYNLHTSVIWLNLLHRKHKTKYSRAPVFTNSVSAVYRGPKKIWKLNKYTVYKFQNARQLRTGRNMVKFSPNAHSTRLIFLCPRTHASPQNLPPFCF
jgi:hypothetical protein